MGSAQASGLGLSKSLLHMVLHKKKLNLYLKTIRNIDFSKSLTSSWPIKLDSKFIQSSKDSDLIFAFNPENIKQQRMLKQRPFKSKIDKNHQQKPELDIYY